MKNSSWLLAICFLVPIFGQAQIKIINTTSKQFTNAYFVGYTDSLKTKGICSLIVNKNQLNSLLKSGKEASIAIKLDPKKYYNLVLLDTSEFPNFYKHITFKYYLPGNTKSITIKEENIEADFWGHCEEEIENKGLDDVVFNVNNKSGSTLVKVYYKFEAGHDFKRLNDLYQWDPVYKRTSQVVKMYDVKPKDTKKIFLKYYTETKGKLSEHLFETEFKKGSEEIDLVIE